MDLVFFILLLIIGIIFIVIKPLFAFIIVHPWITLVLIALGLAISATSKERKRTAFDRLIAENLPYIISFIIAHSSRKRELVLNAKSVLREHFEDGTVRKMMALLKKCDESGVTDGELSAACFQIASNLNYSSRYQIYTILQQIVGEATADEQNALKLIAIKLNLANAGGNAYQSFYDFFRDFAEGYSESYEGGQQRQYRQPNIDYDPYKVLGLTKEASNDEIKKTYRRLCKQYHPDKMADASESEKAEAEKKIREIISAYDKIKQERPGL